jgi:hypothetical protein
LIVKSLYSLYQTYKNLKEIDFTLLDPLNDLKSLIICLGHVGEWLSRRLQIFVSQFDSGRGLQKISCFIFLKKVCCFYSSVAQLVEQLTVNQLVAGSSPARGAN